MRGLTVAEYDALQNDIDKPLLNRALRGTYPPGSTVKPLYALAAQKYNVLVAAADRNFAGVFLPCPAAATNTASDEKHGSISMRRAISESCDVYFFRLADRMGINRMAEFMKIFGYGELTGIDIPGEKPGLYASPEWKRHAYKRPADQVWFTGETISMGIGQGPITVTPLQQAHFTAEIAERGQVIATPRLVAAVRTAGSNAIVPRAPQLQKPIDIATSEQWDVVYDGMVGRLGRAARPMRPASAPSTRSPAKPARRRCLPSSRTKTCTRRSRTNASVITPGSSPTRRPMTRRSPFRCWWKTRGFGASAAAPIARKVLDAYLLGDRGRPDVKKPVTVPLPMSTMKFPPPAGTL